MSLDRIFGVAGGAMDAQVIRMNLAVSNIANAEVTEVVRRKMLIEQSVRYLKPFWRTKSMLAVAKLRAGSA